VERVSLHSGRDVVIRPIRADDEARLREAYQRLSLQSRYQRFLVAKPHLSAAEARYLAGVDGHNHVALVAAPAADQGRLVAVGRFVRRPEDPSSAELAIVVADEYQRDGLGTEILTRLAAAARERGIGRFAATLLSSNSAAYALISGLAAGSARRRGLGAVQELEVDLAA
jgi:RimJ/RimL family protein N-acetyltransferase